MIYFYAGLGAAMLSGIMVLFEVGLSLTGKSLLEEDSYSDHYQDLVNADDQLFLKMLTEAPELRAVGTGRYGSGLCQQIYCRIHGTGCHDGNAKAPLYASLQSFSFPSSVPSIGIWSSSCSLERKLAQSGFFHRILIRPNRESINLGYELYSCILKENSADQRCLFEHGA